MASQVELSTITMPAMPKRPLYSCFTMPAFSLALVDDVGRFLAVLAVWQRPLTTGLPLPTAARCRWPVQNSCHPATFSISGASCPWR
jgi:hypothetical protein